MDLVLRTAPCTSVRKLREQELSSIDWFDELRRKRDQLHALLQQLIATTPTLISEKAMIYEEEELTKLRGLQVKI